MTARKNPAVAKRPSQRPWSPHDLDELRRLIALGTLTYQAIGDILGRRRQCVFVKARALGLAKTNLTKRGKPGYARVRIPRPVVIPSISLAPPEPIHSVLAPEIVRFLRSRGFELLYSNGVILLDRHPRSITEIDAIVARHRRIVERHTLELLTSATLTSTTIPCASRGRG